MSRPVPATAAAARAALPEADGAAFDRLAAAVLASAGAPLGPVLRAQLPGTAGVRWLRQEGLLPTARPAALTTAHWLSLFRCWSSEHRCAGFRGSGRPTDRGPAVGTRPRAGRPVHPALGAVTATRPRPRRPAPRHDRERRTPRRAPGGRTISPPARPAPGPGPPGCRRRGRRPPAGHQADLPAVDGQARCTATSPASSDRSTRAAARPAPGSSAHGTRRSGRLVTVARTSSPASGRSSRSATAPGAPPAGTTGASTSGCR